MRKVFFTYQLMRVRLKLSYYTLVKKATLSEMWLLQIKQSFLYLQRTGQIPKNYFDTDEAYLYDAIPKMKIPDCLRKIVELSLRKQERFNKTHSKIPLSRSNSPIRGEDGISHNFSYQEDNKSNNVPQG